MLIEFRVKNFHSIQDEQVFSLVASSQKQHISNTFNIESEKLTLLKSAAIYGANAAGKSNFIKAFAAMKILITRSNQRGDKLPITPFLLGDNERKPTEFEISFISQSVRYRYGFSVTQDKVVGEWLFAYPNGKMQQLFLRTYDNKTKEYTYEDRNLIGEKKLWEKATRENALFLSTAIQLNNEQLNPIFDWFKTINIGLANGFRNWLEINIKTYKNSSQQILNYLKCADLDIEFLKIDEQDVEFDKLPSELKEMITKSKNARIKQVDIKTTHLNQQGKPIDFDMMNLESDGTKRFFSFLGPILYTLNKGKILIIDELHNRLHPTITRFIIELFHNEKINTKNAQLIFTTHETSVLSKDIFRKDQIYFCEKQNKATKIYSMSDFKGLRKNIDYEKSYLLGRFGALPRLKSIKA